MKEYNLSSIVVHASYTINLGNTIRTENFGFAVDFLRQEVERTQALGTTQIMLHLDAHAGAGPEAGIKQIVKGLSEVLWEERAPQIALGTIAGKGTEIGHALDELVAIIDGVTLNDRLSVILDTCCVSDAGYNVKDDFDGMLAEFGRIIGLDRLKVIHTNDSKDPMGSHKDRHTNIGSSTVDFEALNGVVHHKKLAALSKISETPYAGEDKKDKKASYGFEVMMLKGQTSDPELLEKIQGQD